MFSDADQFQKRCIWLFLEDIFHLMLNFCVNWLSDYMVWKTYSGKVEWKLTYSLIDFKYVQKSDNSSFTKSKVQVFVVLLDYVDDIAQLWAIKRNFKC